MGVPFGTTHSAIKFGSDDEQNRFVEDYRQGSWVGKQERYPRGYEILSFDTAKYPFAEQVSRLLVSKGLVTEESLAEISDFGQLHKIVPDELQELDVHEVNEITRQLYEQDEEFLSVYQKFIKEYVVEHIILGDCVLQKNPTIRFHFPFEKGFDWHPRYHVDFMVGHPPQEVNLFFGLTHLFGSNSLRILSLEDSMRILESMDLDLEAFAVRVQQDEDFRKDLEEKSVSADLKYGDLLLFDSRCIHCCQFNETDATRVSIDVRVIPVDDYNSIRVDYRGTGRMKMQFQRGHYYDQRSAAAL